MSRENKKRVIYWYSPGPSNRSIRVEPCEHFDARGMRRVFGRGDHFGRLTLNMDVWRTRDGRMLARFWSRCEEVDWESYEIQGLLGVDARNEATGELSEHWVPELLRDEYYNWVLSEMRIPPRP